MWTSTACASTLATSPPVAPRGTAPARSFFIYYGWLIADAAGTPAPSTLQIAAERPSLLIAPAYTIAPRLLNLSPAVVSVLRRAKIQWLAYVHVQYRSRPLAEVLAEAERALALGADGILFDQVEYQWGQAQAAYYGDLSALVRGAGRTAAFNTGVACTDERYMGVADMLMLEHSWRSFIATGDWRHAYDPLRFMGVSSNEPGANTLLGYAVDAHAARHDAYVAQQGGVGWHCATDRYVDLSPWPNALAGATA